MLSEFRSLVFQTLDAVSISIGDPDFVPRFIRECIKSAADNSCHCSDTNGSPELRIAISEKLSRENGIMADPMYEILVTARATEAIHVMMQALTEPGDEVIVPDPNYALFEQVQLAGGIPITTPRREETEFRIDCDELRECVDEKTKMITIVSPDNPTGVVLKLDDLKRIAEIADEHDMLVLSDEIYN